MLRTLGLLALAGLLATAAAACGGGDDDSADGGNGTETPAATTATATEPNGDSGGDGGTLQLIAKNTVYDKSELTARAGKVTFEIDNQDAGVAHNFELFKGSDEDGEMMGATEIANGPNQQKLTLTLEAGEYFYWCVVHPATMRGKLTVE